MAGRLNATDRLPARVGLKEFEIFTADDFPAPVGGVIGLPTGLYRLKAPILLSDRINIGTNATVRFCSDQFDNTLTYTGTGTFLSAATSAADFRMDGFFVLMTGVGAQFIDMRAAFVFLRSIGVFGSASGQTIGFMGGNGVAQPFVFINEVQFAGFTDGLSTDNTTVFAMDGVAISTLLGSSNTLISAGENSTRIDLDNLTLDAGSSESAIFLDPTLSGTAVVRDVTFLGSTLFFEAGTTGVITAFADAGVASESITAVLDSVGVARFVFSAPPTLFVGQEVTISGYVVNTDYNVTGIITATGAGFFEIASIAFGTGESGGSFVSDAVIVTDAAHGLSNGQNLLITGTLEYNGGATIYDALTNSFRITRVFVATETGGWDTGSLVETDPRVEATSNPGQKPSMNIGSVIANDVTALTTIATIDTWTDLNLDSFAISGSNIELWTLMDADTGELRYNGLEDHFGSVLASISAVSTGGSREFQFRVVKNGSPLSDAVVAAREFNITIGAITLLAPITVSPGDLVRLQVQNVDTADDIRIEHLSLEVK